MRCALHRREIERERERERECVCVCAPGNLRCLGICEETSNMSRSRRGGETGRDVLYRIREIR
jgi:hypothetical protein